LDSNTSKGTNTTSNATKDGSEAHEDGASIKRSGYTSGKFEYPDMRYYPFEKKGDYMSRNFLAKNDDKKT